MEKNYSNNFGFNNMASDIVVGLDIGTTKVATIIGYLNTKGKIEILGHGKSASKGVEFGLIQNLLKAQESIKTSVQLASSHARLDSIDSVYAGIAARHIRTGNCKHYILRSDHNALITQDELDSMKRDVENIALPPGQQIIAIIPQKYVIEDSADGASHESMDPVGELGSKITGYYQVIMGNYQEIKKIHTCISNVNIDTEELILEPIASGLSCLSEEEKQRGVALIDIGGGTTDMVIFKNGHPKFCKVIPFAGSVITKDIASVCNIPEDTAEELKINHGSCIPERSNPNRVSTVLRPHQQAPLKISDEQLAKIIYSRVHNDILGFVKKELEASGCMKMLQNGAGLVLTGGGAKLRHLVELCQYDLGLNTRIGIPGIGFADSLSNELKQPLYSTALGLLKYGIEKQTKDFHVEEQREDFNNREEDYQQTDNGMFDDKEKKGRKLLDGFKSTLTKLFEQIS
ncbi:MAG: cell division protein FtsA [Bacteroidales bacterium]|jgi:cell division protein FtsA|nr:cell division protein FtsA [Bacteroidales bacterium]